MNHSNFLKVQEYQLTNNLTDVPISLYKYGRVVFLNYDWKLKSALEAGHNSIGKLPQGYMPANHMAVRVFVPDSTELVMLMLDDSSNVSIYNYGNKLPSTGWCRFTATYISI